MKADGTERKMKGAVVGVAGEEERVADDVVDFGIFYVLLVRGNPNPEKKTSSRKISSLLPGRWGKAGPLATKIALMSGCSWS